MTPLRKILLGAVVLLALAFGATLWLLGTDSGTRWMLGRAENYLPDELRLGKAEGSLLRGVSITSIEWAGEPARVQARDIYLDLQLLPLIRKQVFVDELKIARIDINIASSEKEEAGNSSLPAIELPVEVYVDSLSIGPTKIAIDGTQHNMDSLAFSGNLQGSDLLVSKFELRSNSLDLDVDGGITLAESYPGKINAEWKWKESDSGLFVGSLGVDGDMGQYEVRHSLASPLPITTQGTITFEPDNIGADLLSEWNALEWPFGEQTVYSSQGKLRIRGNTNAVVVDLGALAGIDENPESRIEFGGEVRLQPELFFDLEYKVGNLSPALILQSVSGQLNLAGRVAGSVTEQGPDVELVVEQVHGVLNDNAVNGKGEVHLVGNEFSVADAQIAIGPNTVHVDGHVGPSLSLRAEIDATSIKDVLPEVGGSVVGWVSINGSRDNPTMRLELEGTALSWQASSSLEPVDASLSVSGTLHAHTLEAEARVPDSSVAIALDGGLSNQSWVGILTSAAVENAVYGRWATTASSRLFVSANVSEISRTCLYAPDEQGEACFDGRMGTDEPTTFDTAVTGVPLAAFPFQLPEGMTLRGYVDAHLQGEHHNDALTADARIELRETVVSAVYQDEPLSLAVSKAIGRAAVIDDRIESSVEVEFADGAGRGAVDLEVQNIRDPQSGISGEAEVLISDASPLAVFVPFISNPQGRIDGAMSIGGSLAAPELLGRLALANASFGVRQSGILIEELNVELAQLSPGRLRLSGSARSGDGDISIEGQTELGADTGIRTEIQIDGDNFELARLPDWQIAASPSVAIVFDDRIVSVDGDLTIPRANITLAQIPESAARASSDAVVHREDRTEPSQARRVVVDVDVSLGSDVQLSGFGLSTGLEGNVQILGGSHTPFTGNGRLTLRDGRYTAYKQELEIERGELIFSGPLENPQLDVRAVRRANDVVAGILLSGTPTQLRSEVFSEPAMSDAEALSYLLTGRPLGGATSGAEGDVLNNAAFALGLSGAGAITSQIRNELGLETLTIEGGADDSRLIAGKRFGDRLLVEYGYGLVDKLGTLLLRYQLNERIVLESRTGTVSNLDIVYSVKKK